MMRTRRTTRNLWLILLVAVAPAAAWGSGPFQRSTTFYTSRNPRISVTNLNGTIVVKGWERPQVYAVYLIASPRVEIDTEQVPSQGEAAKIQLATHLLDRSLQGSSARVDYTLDVPAGASLEIRNPQGSVRIDSLKGDAWVRSVGGDITIADSSGRIIAHSLGGQIEIDRSSGYVEASSVTGSLKFVSPTSSEIQATTTSGKIFYEGSLVPAADYRMSTYDGDIDFLCPPSSSFELHARSVHGKLENELKLSSRQHHDSVSSYGTALFGMHNQGTATLELTSFRGTIRISAQPQQ